MSKMPIALCAGEINIGDISIPCAVLEDGTRVLTQQGVLLSIGRARAAKGGEGASVDGLPAFLRAKNIKPFIPEDLAESTKAIQFRSPSGTSAFGYRAELLPQICAVFIDADDDGKVRPNQRHIVDRCRILFRGFATVGIIALVDEATGFQYDRAGEALAEILEAFIAKELTKWVKTFPDEFYKELFRLRGWSYSSFSNKRPVLAGKLTNDIVYRRLAPGVLEELRDKNPVTPKGWRQHRHHQWLTGDFGHPRLREHLAAVIALMKAAPNWSDFRSRLNRALPKHLSMPLFAQPER